MKDEIEVIVWEAKEGKLTKVAAIVELESPVPIVEAKAVMDRMRNFYKSGKPLLEIEAAPPGHMFGRAIPSDRLLAVVQKVPIDSAVLALLRLELPKGRPIGVADIKLALAKIGAASGRSKSYAYLKHLRQSGALTSEGMLKEDAELP